MDPMLNSSTPARDRAAVVRRLRNEVSTGAYVPPVDLLVDRLVSILIADRAVGHLPTSARSTRASGRV